MKNKGCKCGCEGNNHYCDTHFCSEICKQYNGTRPQIEVVASPRIDYCGVCKKEHGYDCPNDWKDREREAFAKWYREVDSSQVYPLAQKVPDYWISRIGEICQENFLEADSFYRQRKDEWDIETRQKERARLIAFAKAMMHTHECKRAKCKRDFNQALAEFIEKSNEKN